MTTEKPIDGDCGTCKWWVTQRDSAKFGRCHGGPPTANLNDSEKTAIWPQTKRADWCGRFERSIDPR